MKNYHLGKRAGNPAIYDEHGQEIADMLTCFNGDWQDDARLFCASPDLLAACKVALDAIKASFPLEHGNPVVGKAWGELESAIAKAERRGA